MYGMVQYRFTNTLAKEGVKAWYAMAQMHETQQMHSEDDPQLCRDNPTSEEKKTNMSVQEKNQVRMK